MDRERGSLELMKQINKSIILDTVKLYGPISRAEISQRTNLSPTTVSTLTGDLIREEYIKEIGEGKSRGGRRPILLKFNSNAHFIMGVKLDAKEITLALVNLKLSIINKKNEVLKNRDKTRVIKQVSNLILKEIQESGVKLEKIIGIGIGTIGLVDTEKGIVEEAVNIGWRNVPLRDLIKERFNDIPVYIDNVANLSALGEKQAGIARKAKNLIYLHLGMGIGAGIVLNGKIYEGSNGSAGEVGHTTVEPDGPQCKCGNRGCLEIFASEGAIASRAISGLLARRKTLMKKMSGGSIDKVTVRLVAKAAEKGDKFALEIWKETAKYLGITIANLINVYNPEMVILGGGIVRAGKFLFEPLKRVVRERALPRAAKIVRIVPSQLKDDASLIGAAALALEKTKAFKKI
ncbi:ROK family protein [Candidatus Aerophobetes bacterium]|nr:ROK family protein [Candidatus Aerophobetes bacterium]